MGHCVVMGQGDLKGFYRKVEMGTNFAFHFQEHRDLEMGIRLIFQATNDGHME